MADGGRQAAASRWRLALIVAAILFGVLAVGPSVWARAQLNLFMRDLTRVWTADTLIPSQDACPPADEAMTERMAARLARAAEADPNILLHQGELACVQGHRAQARTLWESGAEEVPPDPITSLFAAIAAFPDRQIIASPYQKAMGQYGSGRGRREERQEDIPTAIDWYEFSLAYAPSGATAGKLAALYRQLGRDASVEEVWQRLQSSFSSESAEYWWALGQMAEQQKDWEAAASAYQKAAALAAGEDAFKYFLREGLMWLRARDFEKAAAAYQQAIGQKPDKVDGYLGMGHVFRYQKQYARAVPWYEKAIEAAPNHYAAYYYLGTMAREQGDYEQAVAYFDKALARNPRHADSFYQKALALDAMGKREAALKILDEAIGLTKKPPPSWLELQDNWRRYPDKASDPAWLWRQGREAEAARDWAKAESYYKLAAEMARPEDAYPYLLQQARMLQRLGQEASAHNLFLRLTQQYPDRVDGYLALGHEARRQGDWETARQWYERARQVDPKNHLPLLYLGMVARNQGNNDQALDYFNRALALKPDLPDLLYSKAVTLDALGRRSEAAPVLDDAIANHPSPPQSWLDLQSQWRKYPTHAQDPAYWGEQARKAEKAGNFEEALRLYEKAVSLAQGEDAYPYWLKIGRLRIRTRDDEGAAEAYSQALALNDDAIEPYIGMGESYRYRKDYAQAETWYRQAWERFPDDFRPPYYLGVVFYSQKRYEEALTMLDDAQAKHPESPWIAYYRAVTLRALGRDDEAIKSLEQAIDLSANPPESWLNLLDQWRSS